MRGLNSFISALTLVGISLITSFGADSFRPYVVKKSESLSSIASAFGVSRRELAEFNKIPSSSHLVVGQRLKIPGQPRPKKSQFTTIPGGAPTPSLRAVDSAPLPEISEAAVKAPSTPPASPTPTVSVPKSNQVTYTVRAGDKLELIAKEFGVTKTSLMELNSINQANRILVGQVLKIPGKILPGLAMNPAMKRELDQIISEAGRWQYVVIHHTATKRGTPKGFDEVHRKQGMENGLAYHFLIGNGQGLDDGKVYIAPRWLHQLDGGHVKSEEMNHKAIGICLVGNFEDDRPSANQMKSLGVVIAYLMQRCDIPITDIKTHHEINTVPTKCPGRNFSQKLLLDTLDKAGVAGARELTELPMLVDAHHH